MTGRNSRLELGLAHGIKKPGIFKARAFIFNLRRKRRLQASRLRSDR